jgi:predicted SpoU family rRNA methylase
MISEYARYRMYEILPGLTIWGSLIAMVVLSFVQPLWMIYFIIVFDVYWVLKVINFGFYLILAWRRLSVTRRIDWKKKMMHELTNWDDKRHLIFLTLYNEPWDVVQTAIQSVCDAVYKKEQFTLVIAGEEKTADHYRDILNRIEEKFGHCFADVVGTMHPIDREEEIPGKGSNLHYAEAQLKVYVDKKGWHYDNIIATIFDIDTVCHDQYFAYLTYLYCTHPNPTRSSFQPIALYNNNMWESPAPIRIMSFGTTFWLMMWVVMKNVL